ncbi:MAG: dockerin type I domain-containing protein [Acutalibacteraceae bacterium]
MKKGKALLSCLLTVCLMITPFAGVLVFADETVGPQIEFGVAPLAAVTADTEIAVTVTPGDNALASCETRIEGTAVSNEAAFSFTPDEQGLTDGVHTLVTEATDTEGNTAIKTLSFKVVTSVEAAYTLTSDTVTAEDSNASVSVYAADALSFTSAYGSTQDGSIDPAASNAFDALSVYKQQYAAGDVTTSSATGIPYQTFDVQLGGKTDGEIIVQYSGSTKDGERVAVKVYSPADSCWETLGTFTGTGSVSAPVNVADYADGDVIHVAAVLDYVTNGSNSFIWITDPQHYTKFEDLNEYYYQVYQYAAAQYLAGNVGYVMNTGDLVDDRPTAAVAEAQWQVADKAMHYVEDIGMPNGVVTGNHDVGDYNYTDYEGQDNLSSDYSMFGQYFGYERYNDKPWYGASLNNNTSHYDLITIGNVDFVIVYLGYGFEATDETIEWVNQVLQTYRHRTAIIATHDYIKNSLAAYNPTSRAQLIFDTMVEPNSNVKMVLCGHDDGSQILEKTTSDGRTVYEILSDYQFVEAESRDFYNGLEHYIGSVPGCCGDGYLRTMTITGDSVANVTYSPVTGGTNPYGDRESFTINVDFGTADRVLTTTGFSAAVKGEERASGTGAAALDTSVDCLAAITSDGHVTYTAVQYTDIPEAPEAAELVPNDLAALHALIDKVQTIEQGSYTDDSFAALQEALTAAKAQASSTDNAAIVKAYRALENALGALKTVHIALDPADYQTLYTYDMTLSKWKNEDTNLALTSDKSYIKGTQTENGGIHMEKSEAAKNDWPSAVYTGGTVTLRPNNGKIYLNLDVVANSSWCIYLDVEQGNASTSLRLNHAIEHFYKTDADGFAGTYQELYDVTDAFTAAGFDPSATLTVKATLLYIVPGDVTYTHLEFMTDISDAPLDTTALEEAIAAASELDESLYTVSTYKRVKTAITSAQNALTDETMVQADINLKLLQLNQAVAKLKLLSEITPEPENSLLPADEGQWIPNANNVMDIYRDDDGYTVLQNTNNAWPYADYTLPEARTLTVADTQFTMDITVGEKTNIYMMIDGSWVSMCKYISDSRTNADGDLQSGTYTVGIPLSSISALKDKETVSVQKLRVYSVGSASSSAVTIRRWTVDDYEAPPYVEESLANMMPQSYEEIQLLGGEGSHELKNGVLTIQSTSSEQEYRLNLTPQLLYNMTKLNGLHMVVDSEVPFKIALNVKSTNDTGNWPTTSDPSLSSIFPVTDDRVAPGSYDATFDLAGLCSSITDKSAVYYAQVVVVTNGVGTFKLKTLEALKFDDYQWDESLTYGEAATPDHPYYAHAAKKGPEVAEKVDLLEALGLTEHCTITQWTPLGNSMGLKIDLTKTPYLYMSVAQADTSSFTFSLYNDNTGNKVPWLLFRDAAAGDAKMTSGAANWDKYQQHEQYVSGSETICIDMREYLNDSSTTVWTVNSVTLYNYLHENAVVSYMFFGSEPAEPEELRGDINRDGMVNMLDAQLLYYSTAGLITLTDDQTAVSDVNGDGTVNLSDSALLYQITSSVTSWSAAGLPDSIRPKKVTV